MPRLRPLALIVALIGLALVAPAVAGDRPLLSASAETPSHGEVRPPARIVGAVLAVMDKADIEQLDDCLADQGLPKGDRAALLRAVPVRTAKGQTLWFVRPALKPYCHALYGAHLFRYFLVEERKAARRPRVMFQDGGDAFAILPTRNHGLNDIEATGCIATECNAARMSFDGHRYIPVRCSRLTSDDQGREVREARACGADGGRDDQASGATRRDPR